MAVITITTGAIN